MFEDMMNENLKNELKDHGLIVLYSYTNEYGVSSVYLGEPFFNEIFDFFLKNGYKTIGIPNASQIKPGSKVIDTLLRKDGIVKRRVWKPYTLCDPEELLRSRANC